MDNQIFILVHNCTEYHSLFVKMQHFDIIENKRTKNIDACKMTRHANENLYCNTILEIFSTFRQIGQNELLLQIIKIENKTQIQYNYSNYVVNTCQLMIWQAVSSRPILSSWQNRQIGVHKLQWKGLLLNNAPKTPHLCYK